MLIMVKEKSMGEIVINSDRIIDIRHDTGDNWIINYASDSRTASYFIDKSEVNHALATQNEDEGETRRIGQPFSFA